MTDIVSQIQALHSSDVQQRLAAAEALCAMGEQGAQATIALIDALTDADERVREAANAALEGIGAPPPDNVASLAERLCNANGDCAYWAATLLGRLGEEAQAAAAQLTAVVQDEQRPANVRKRCAWALGKIRRQ